MKAVAKKASKMILPFPGVPKRPQEPLVHKDFSVYTDMKQSKWRVKRAGHRKDIGATWTSDPRGAWAKVMQVLDGRLQIPTN